MISDQDRKLAEETFDFIERSEASGNSYEANLPVGASEPGDWGYEYPVEYVMAPESEHSVPMKGCPICNPVTLAEHTASAIDKILGA